MTKIVFMSAMAISAFFEISHHAVKWYFSRNDKSFEEHYLYAKEKTEVIDNYDALAKEAEVIISYAKENKTSYIDENLLSSIAPLVLELKTNSLGMLWIEREVRYEYGYKVKKGNETIISVPSIRIPEHVVIRYGTHSSYAWMLIFATDNDLFEFPGDLIHVGGTVYLSDRKF